MSTLARQQFTTTTENAINEQIQIDQIAQQTYLSASAFFGRDDVALPGLQHYFLEQAEHEGHRAQMLIDYQNTRGGRVCIKEIIQPQSEWISARSVIETSLDLEKDVNKAMLNLSALSIQQQDAHLKHHLKSTHLRDKVVAIEQLARHLTQLERVGNDGLGLHLWDANLHKQSCD